MLKYYLSTLILFFLAAIPALAFHVPEDKQQQITEEAENRIDDIPAGYQDRLSDAINHAISGQLEELQYFRNNNAIDTTGISSYNVSVNDFTLPEDSSIKIRLYQPSVSFQNPLPVLIFFHGGGWVTGSLQSSDKFCRALVAEKPLLVFSVDYPLSPENPYPKASEACEKAFRYISSNISRWEGDPSKISIGGEDAGGNLGLDVYAAMAASGQQENDKIASMVLYYPLLNPEKPLNPEMKKQFGRGFGFDSRVWEAIQKAYNRKVEENRFLAELPPTLLIASGRDIMFASEKELASNCSEIQMVEFSGALHGFLSDGAQPTAFHEAVVLTSEFLIGK